MASSENQGLQITVIVLLITVLPLAVVAWVFFGQSNSYYSQLTADKVKLQEADANLRKAIEDVNKYKQMIGLPDEADSAKASTTFNDDMAGYGATLPAEKKFYRQALEELSTTLAKTMEEKAATQAKINEIELENTKARNEANVQVEAANKSKDDAVKELETQKAAFMEGQKKADAEKKDILDQLAKAQSDAAAETDKQNKTIEQLAKEVKTAGGTISTFQTELAKLRGGTFDVDDGELRSVQPRNETVLVNLGEADGLRPQTTFFVHSPNVSPSDMLARKGKIEVTQIMGEHLAEARIVDSKKTDPMLPGDKIYTSLWDPGRREHFAIAGRIDFNGDGVDDREQLRNIIRLSGGVIDAEIDTDGKQAGGITIDTRYLIEGPMPEKARAATNKLEAEAALLGVERIGVDKFLDHIGYKGSQQVIRYGITGNVDTVTRPLPDGGLPKDRFNFTDSFRKRQPQQQPVAPPTFQ
ncbi:MAG TPA: hypothetical protein VHZ24_05160 [Pirellulales bacterium]|jgi:hypothetical protein|nr:hypothetical protein [Pirellulales bacterium]